MMYKCVLVAYYVYIYIYICMYVHRYEFLHAFEQSFEQVIRTSHSNRSFALPGPTTLSLFGTWSWRFAMTGTYDWFDYPVRMTCLNEPIKMHEQHPK